MSDPLAPSETLPSQLPATDSLKVSPLAWQLHCDGSALPNPGRMGLGVVLTAPDGTRHTASIQAPERGCNNEAELRAFLAGLDLAAQHGATALRVYSDSSILVEQLQTPGVRPIARLAGLFQDARAQLAGFAGGLQLVWIPQRRNSEADALARAALGLTQPRAVKPAKRRKKKR